jgi:exodeoxyribonuclease VII small subunit
VSDPLPPPPQPFEVSLDRLEKIVRELEAGSVPLERALELFEEGMKLAEVCRAQLDAAESRVEMLVRKPDGRMQAQPFSLESGEGKRQG